MRLDLWLWSVRLYRSRTLAATAVRAGHVKVDGQPAKPAREIHPGEQVTALTGTVTRIYRVTGNPPSRVSASRVPEFAADLTPPPASGPAAGAGAQPGPVLLRRPRGSGRPTKRERRVLDRFVRPGD